MDKALIVGGNSGIGLALALRLIQKDNKYVYIIGKDEPMISDIPVELRDIFFKKTSFFKIDLNFESYSIFDNLDDIDTLIITAGFGRATLFENLTECEIKNLVKCNELSIIQIIRKYYVKIKSFQNFNCAVIVSICGHVVSPFFSVYGAAKAGLKMFIENINSELLAEGYTNRVLDCSPGSIKGTNFNGFGNDISLLYELADDIIYNMKNNIKLFIPKYSEIYKDVIQRYQNNPEEFCINSYEYKLKSGRINDKPQIIIGFLSGTFDLFHIGHLNLLKRAKENCDYLIVAVHSDGSWKGKQTFIPYEERVEIVKNIKYVDEVVQDFKEDIDAWPLIHYDKLFVGSDYKGTERFNRYEEYFKEKGVEIIYFSYTKGTSSTQLREALISLNEIK